MGMRKSILNWKFSGRFKAFHGSGPRSRRRGLLENARLAASAGER